MNGSMKATAAYFSPTGGTRSYVKEIAGAMSATVEELDLTCPAVRRQKRHFRADEVLVLGVPVYYGRVPEVPDLLDGLEGENTPVVLAAVYGNRAVDDALMELSDMCAAHGFRVVAAGEFIAPHTFSAKIGTGRPDETDKETARELGRRTLDKLEQPDWQPVELPGNRPYRSFQRAPFYPEGEESCVNCGACVLACPVEAISVSNPRQTDAERCLRCLACVKACPTGSRAVRGMAFDATRQKLEQLLQQPRQPVLYL